MELKIAEKSAATICLNMIVKDEAHIIVDTLTKLCSKIRFDYWVICDTGSTDNTGELITDFFNKKNIKGELFYDEWENFAQNRTMALQRAYNKTDLLLIFDADDEICGNITMPTEVIGDQFLFKFGSEHGASYTRVLLINNRKEFEYKSVIHEFISCKEAECKTILIDGDYYVVSGRSGSRNKDPKKYLKDAQILEKAHADAVKNGDDLKHRYAFYCANSYKDHGDNEKAIEWYKITLSQEQQWDQEKYMACLYIYECYERLKQQETGFYYLVKAFKYDSQRLECLYPLLVHYCCQGMSQISYNYYLNVKEFYENKYLEANLSLKLFAQPDKYNFFVPYYMIIIADRIKEHKIGIKMYEIVFIKKQKIFTEFFVKNLLYNLQFFLPHLLTDGDYKLRFINLANDYIRFLRDNSVNMSEYEFLQNKVYNNAGINLDFLFVKEITNKASIFPKEKCQQSKNVLVYTGYNTVDWNYSYMAQNALGGSEKAVAYLTQYFPKDCIVYVAGNVKNEIIDNIHYISLNDLSVLVSHIAFHTVIVSRYISFYELYPQCSFYKSYIWVHDTMLLPYGLSDRISDKQIIQKWNNYIDGCVCLTDWHKNLFSKLYPQLANKIHIINNGIEISQFPSSKSNNKIVNRFIYTSRPERGLRKLLDLWPQILDKIPNATLAVACYGNFPCSEDERSMKQTMDNYKSIQFLGRLNTSQLYEAMSLSEYWLYPTNWSETSCITALEMLMNEVICVYYPVAGLVNTIQHYGVQIESGAEIDTIVSLANDSAKTMRMRRVGKKYAESCSWLNRGKIWNNMLFGMESEPEPEIETSVEKIAIFNSFPFHYEMFGFILNYAKNNDYAVDIYTNEANNLGWLDFYKNTFPNINYINYELYKPSIEYKLVFVTTDDDPRFKTEWITDSVICIQHYYKIRNPIYKHYINIAKFRDSELDYAVPCYPLIQAHEKNVENLEIAIIGGGIIQPYKYDSINRLTADVPITLNIIGRKFNHNDISKINKKFIIKEYEGCDATSMFEILKTCSYILINYNTNNDHDIGKSASGSLPIGLTSLCKLVVSSQTNNIFNMQNTLEFDLESNEPIYLDKKVDFSEIQKERDFYINKFDNLVSDILNKNNGIVNIANKIPKKIIQTWEHKNIDPEFQKIIDYWKLHNPNYEYTLFDNNERLEFIKHNFDKNVLETYNNIHTGAHKADLFRYCYLYINGGFYADIDSLCLGKIDDFLTPNTDFMVPIDLNVSSTEGEHNLACGFIASSPKHPILLNCINKIVYNIQNNIILPSRLDFTGPGILGRATNIYLGNPETASFVGKEGIYKNIHFLNFERGSEYIRNKNNSILCQNKNGNPEIIRLYNEECQKLNNYISWVNCPNNKLVQRVKNIAVTVYGQFRSYKNNLIANLHMLQPIFNSHKIHVFILSDKLPDGNYSDENEKEILSIFNKFNYCVHFIAYFENSDSNHEDEFTKLFLDYTQNRNRQILPFVPNLLYRKYLLNKLKNNYIKKHKIPIDLHCYCRLFDIKIKNNIAFTKITSEIDKLYETPNMLYGSSDVLFIGQEQPFDYLFNICESYKQSNFIDDAIWNDIKFVEFVEKMDYNLCKNRDTYSPEIQYIARMYFSEYSYKNIRVDFTNPHTSSNNDGLYKIVLDPLRNTETRLLSTVINITEPYMTTIINNVPKQFLKYYSSQGLIDYNKNFGKEHYKLLCCISEQIKSGIIVDIGTHNGNSAVSLGYSMFNNNDVKIYSFDIKNLLMPSCKEFFDTYSVNYSLENIFEEHVREKYKDVLLSSKLIMVDIDPHDGILEYEIYKWLEEHNYQGFILYDDIFLKKGHVANNYNKTVNDMITFWNKIPEKNRINLTDIGHWSGTGLVSFNFEKNIFIM